MEACRGNGETSRLLRMPSASSLDEAVSRSVAIHLRGMRWVLRVRLCP